MHQLRALWGEEPGTERPITPQPVQKPMPMWGGFRGPQGARMAGELGLGLQSLKGELLAPYLEGLEAGGHDSRMARMAGSVELYVTDDPERTWAEIEPYVTYRWKSYNRHMFQGTKREQEPPQYFDADGLRQQFLLGTPEQLAAQLRERTAGLPVTDLYVWADHTGLSEAAVDRHIELLVTRLYPLLKDEFA
jgi:alkanesulfonate monooxygenase SsuD/methylene tetrahydromethanopterin reductase-like flavin-dependent oxidoreductase (luciferase family)